MSRGVWRGHSSRIAWAVPGVMGNQNYMGEWAGGTTRPPAWVLPRPPCLRLGASQRYVVSACLLLSDRAGMLSHKAGDACDKPGAQAVSGFHSIGSSGSLPSSLCFCTTTSETLVLSHGCLTPWPPSLLEDHVMGSGSLNTFFKAKFWASLALRTGDKEIQQQLQMSMRVILAFWATSLV